MTTKKPTKTHTELKRASYHEDTRAMISSGGSRNRTTYVTIGLALLLGLLVVTAGVQAYQLTSMRHDMAAASEHATRAGTGASGSGPSSLDQSIDALPQQVGGC